MKNRKFTAAFLVLAMTFGISALPAAELVSISVTVSAAETKLSAPKTVVSSVRADSVTLQWKNVKGAGAYRIYRYDASSKKYKPAYTSSSNSYTITGLKANKTYYFKVAALEKENGKYIAGTLSNRIKVKTAPEFPNLLKYGFAEVPIDDSETGKQMQAVLDSNPGMMVSLVPVDSRKSLTEQFEDAGEMLNNYCAALEKRGFAVEYYNEDTVPADDGYIYTYRYLIKYNNNTLAKISYSIFLGKNDDPDESLYYRWGTVMLIPINE